MSEKIEKKTTAFSHETERYVHPGNPQDDVTPLKVTVISQIGFST